MRTIALFVDDASSARLALRPLLAAENPGRVILVACAPRLSRHIGRWLNQASRDQYRQRWARELFSELQPLWSKAPRGSIETMTLQGPLQPLAQRLREQLGTDLVSIDLRAARLGQRGEPLESGGARSTARRWWIPAAAVTSGLGLALALAD